MTVLGDEWSGRILLGDNRRQGGRVTADNIPVWISTRFFCMYTHFRLAQLDFHLTFRNVTTAKSGCLCMTAFPPPFPLDFASSELFLFPRIKLQLHIIPCHKTPDWNDSEVEPQSATDRIINSVQSRSRTRKTTYEYKISNQKLP